MSEDKFTWVEVASDIENIWEELINQSPQGTIFHTKKFLSASGVRHRLFLIKRGREVKAGLTLIESSDGKSLEADDLVIHSGLVFARNDLKKLVKKRFEEFEIAEMVARWIAENYQNATFCLSPQFEDARAFQWYNYHSLDEKVKYRVDLKYTSYLGIDELSEKTCEESDYKLFADMETLRQRHIRAARREKGRVVRAESAEALVGFYEAMMLDKDEQQEHDKLERMRNTIDTYVDSNDGAVYNVITDTEEIVYSVAYLIDSKRAYYVFGAGPPEANVKWRGTLAHWEAFLDLSRRLGVREIDFEGINSPMRGWFKTGFGGTITPYCEITYPSGLQGQSQ